MYVPETSPQADTASGASDAFTRFEKLVYLRSLFPYAPFTELIKAVDIAQSTNEAVQSAYELLNPDVYGYSFLEGQWKQKHDKKMPKAEREAAFQGVSDILCDRADDILPQNQFISLSQLGDYDKSVHPYVIDTAKWDECCLLSGAPLEEMLEARMCLCPDSEHDDVCQGPFRTYGTSRENINATSEGESLLVNRTNSMLSAPIPRWAPAAVRVSEEVAQQCQEDVFNIFEESLSFSFGFLNSPRCESPHRDQHEPAAAATAVAGTFPAPTDGGGSALPANTAATAAAAENHEPDAAPLPPPAPAPAPAPAGATATSEGEGPFTRKNSHTGSGSELHGNNQALPGCSSGNSMRAALQRRQQLNVDLPKDFSTRLKNRTLLGNVVFQYSSNASFTSSRRAADDGDEDDEGDAAAASGDDMLAFGGELEFLMEHYKAEEQKWNEFLAALKPYEQLFNDKNRCHLVGSVYDHCPGFVKNVDKILRAFLSIASHEVLGRTLLYPQEEVVVQMSILGEKLVSFGSITVKELSFDREKCSLQFLEEGATATASVTIDRLTLEPLEFAYISEKKAAKRMRQLHRQRTGGGVSSRAATGGGLTSSSSHNMSSTYDSKDVTSGVLNLEARNTKVQVWGFAYLLSTGKVAVIIEKTKVSVGSLRLKSDVTKLNVLFTLAKPIIKSIVKKQVESALTRTHVL